MFSVKMAQQKGSHTEQPQTPILPFVPNKAALLKQSFQTTNDEAPYRALIGVVVDARSPPPLSKKHNSRARNQTGLTNRWRNPESLYGDFLGSRQALNAVNLPFNQTLVKALFREYPSINPVLSGCKEFSNLNTANWSVMKTVKVSAPAKDEDEDPMSTI